LIQPLMMQVMNPKAYQSSGKKVSMAPTQIAANN
jgi:hypothetical protein